jgi:hypothetical protein
MANAHYMLDTYDYNYTLRVSYSLLFHDNSGCRNVPQCYFTRLTYSACLFVGQLRQEILRLVIFFRLIPLSFFFFSFYGASTHVQACPVRCRGFAIWDFRKWEPRYHTQPVSWMARISLFVWHTALNVSGMISRDQLDWYKMDINNFELEVLGLSLDGPNNINFWTIKLTWNFNHLQL